MTSQCTFTIYLIKILTLFFWLNIFLLPQACAIKEERALSRFPVYLPP